MNLKTGWTKATGALGLALLVFSAVASTEDGLAEFIAERRAVVTLNPNDLQATLELAQALQAAGRSVEARAVAGDLRAMLERSPAEQNPDWLYTSAMAAEILDEEDVRADLERALEIRPNHLLSLLAISRIDAAEDRFADAIERLEEVLPDHPTPQPLQQMVAQLRTASTVRVDQMAAEADTALRAGESRQARRLLFQAERIDPDHQRVKQLQAVYFHQQAMEAKKTGNYERALLHWSRALGYLPDNPYFLFESGVIHIHLGNLQQAETELMDLLKNPPDRPEFFVYLAYTLCARGKAEQGINLLELSLNVAREGGDRPAVAAFEAALDRIAVSEDLRRIFEGLPEFASR